MSEEQEKEEQEKEGQEKKKKTNRLEHYTKLIGIVGALVAVFSGIYQLAQGNFHNARELRWKQAGLAREMVNKMVEDEGWKAMEMMDWDDAGRDYEINGKKEKINVHTVYAALEKSESTDADRYIIDRLDRSFFLISQLESAVRSELVRIEDVKFPLSWYAAKRMCPRKKLFEDYMNENAAPETLQFFRRLDEWNNCK
jgi:hypothetical protein